MDLSIQHSESCFHHKSLSDPLVGGSRLSHSQGHFAILRQLSLKCLAFVNTSEVCSTFLAVVDKMESNASKG